MTRIVLYDNNRDRFIFATNGDNKQANLEATSLDKINRYDGKGRLLKIIHECNKLSVYPTFDFIVDTYNKLIDYEYEVDFYEATDKKYVTEQFISNYYNDSEERELARMYKSFSDLLGIKLTRSEFVKEFAQELVDLKRLDEVFNSVYSSNHNEQDKQCEQRTNHSDECANNAKGCGSEYFEMPHDLLDFLSENGYDDTYKSFNYIKSGVDPYENYDPYKKEEDLNPIRNKEVINRFKSDENSDYNVSFKEAYKLVKKAEDRIGAEIDELVNDFTLYLKKADFKYALVNEFSREFLNSKGYENTLGMVEIRGIFEVFLNGFTGSNKMMNRLLHLISVENADHAEIKETLVGKLRRTICDYGADAINKKFDYLIKTKVYFENHKYYVEFTTKVR